jgi:hypothetical protein
MLTAIAIRVVVADDSYLIREAVTHVLRGGTTSSSSPPVRISRRYSRRSMLTCRLTPLWDESWQAEPVVELLASAV